MTDKILLTAAFLLGGYTVFRLLKVLATLGDRKWAARRERMRLVTPYTPPLNARPNDFDSLGRPY